MSRLTRTMTVSLALGLAALLLPGGSRCRALAQTPAAGAGAKRKLVRADWYLLSHEGAKIGYENKSVYRLDGDGPARWHVQLHRFLKESPGDRLPSCIETTTMELDRNWTALSFQTSRSGLHVEAANVSGTLDGETLTVTARYDDEEITSTTPVTGSPTFAATMLDWAVAKELAVGKGWSRTVVDERSGVFVSSPRVVQVISRMQIENPPGPAFVLADVAGGVVTGHVVRPDGQRIRSEGQNHNRAAQRVPAVNPSQMDLTERIAWQNHIQIKAGHELASETFGYRLTLPGYPFLPAVVGDGQVVMADRITGSDGVHVLVQPVPRGKEVDAALLRQWQRLAGATSDVIESRRPVGGLPARIYRGKLTVGGRPGRFRVAAVVREHLGYLVGYITFAPDSARDGAVFDTLLRGITWTRIFGRERGHWEGGDYVSDSYGYRLRLLGPGWQVPEGREGVPTSIEAVRDDRSAVLVVLHEPVEEGSALEDLAADYETRIMQKVEGANGLTRRETTLDGQPAVVLTYQARAIDGEPTESRHVLAVAGGRLTTLTLVSKRSSLETNAAHFEAALASFRFGEPPAPAQPIDPGGADGMTFPDEEGP